MVRRDEPTNPIEERLPTLDVGIIKLAFSEGYRGTLAAFNLIDFSAQVTTHEGPRTPIKDKNVGIIALDKFRLLMSRRVTGRDNQYHVSCKISNLRRYIRTSLLLDFLNICDGRLALVH